MKPFRIRLQEARTGLGLHDFLIFLREKCFIKNVNFEGPDDFIPETWLSHVKKH